MHCLRVRGLENDAANLIEDLMVQGQHNLASLRSEAVGRVLTKIDTLDRLIDRQFKNVKLLMQRRVREVRAGVLQEAKA